MSHSLLSLQKSICGIALTDKLHCFFKNHIRSYKHFNDAVILVFCFCFFFGYIYEGAAFELKVEIQIRKIIRL